MDKRLAEDLDRFVMLLTRWQSTHNLVSAKSVQDVWTRHIADSLQLVDRAPPFECWTDLGSGAGFPGLIVALHFRSVPHKRFTLIEANGKKAAFLRAVARQLQLQINVVPERIETAAKQYAKSADIVSARALAPLSILVELASPFLREKATLLLLKGQDFVEEHRLASISWEYDVEVWPSVTHASGRIVAISGLKPRGR